ncbi:MAG: cobalamin-independent methionine synthase II family protein [Solirubrobacterales bacterium]|nr:cobalamin-independent methionine synthase II family protein [Solirubrobacterales bacterium]MBV9364507.1 cobalamin-independent methionine synthase II family protein [Solirubrobacterales bacterium]MBV9810957.1 cobalamin-independent methionine synthase II family protein [Solirubrobacterales bacterium]
MDRILATHTGSLIRPPELLAFLAAKERGQEIDVEAYQRCLRESVSDVVRRQVQAGIDVPDDGEMGKASWITYLYERVSGLEVRPIQLEGGTMLPPSRDRQAFPGAYAALDALDEAAVRASNAAASSALPDDEAAARGQGVAWVCVGPLSYDRAGLDRDIANFKAALAEHEHDVVDAFLPVVAPASAYWLQNEYYSSDEEFVFALADALREEYRAIVDAGLLVQVDDAVMMHEADTMMSRGESWDEYRRWADLRVRALNHALEGLPEERIRYHVCWGSWHGPHAFDPPLADVVDLILAVNAGTYAVEQANPRHEHEWRVWEDARLPAGKKLIPGVVTHHTNVVEHPELVAQRLIRLAGVVGRENVLAGTDCGFAQGAFIQRVHPETQWAKLEALAEGARLASRELWGAKAAA